MPNIRFVGPGLLPAMVMLACVSGPAQRDQAALKLVVQLHRELYLSRHRLVQSFSQQPETSPGRQDGLWANSPFADPEGQAFAKVLLTNYLAVKANPQGQAMGLRVRAYFTQRARVDQKKLESLQTPEGLDPDPFHAALRQALVPIYGEDYAITMKYLAKAEALPGQ